MSPAITAVAAENAGLQPYEVIPIAFVVASAAGRDKEATIEIEVDGLDQLREALPFRPDAVLLDNMSTALLTQAVEIVDGLAKTEASGGVRLETVKAIAQTGVDYISAGALTHSAVNLDVGLDFES